MDGFESPSILKSESCDKVPAMTTPAEQKVSTSKTAYQWQRARSMARRYWHTSPIRHLALTVLDLEIVPKAGRRAGRAIRHCLSSSRSLAPLFEPTTRSLPRMLPPHPRVLPAPSANCPLEISASQVEGEFRGRIGSGLHVS